MCILILRLSKNLPSACKRLEAVQRYLYHITAPVPAQLSIKYIRSATHSDTKERPFFHYKKTTTLKIHFKSILTSLRLAAKKQTTNRDFVLERFIRTFFPEQTHFVGFLQPVRSLNFLFSSVRNTHGEGEFKTEGKKKRESE